MNKSLDEMRREEIAHVRKLAREHGLTVNPSDIEFAENGHLPYIDGMDAEDWIEQMTINDYRPYSGEREALQAFRDELDETHEPLELLGVGGYLYSRVVERVDPVSFRTEFNNWLDALQRDLPDEDDEEDED